MATDPAKEAAKAKAAKAKAADSKATKKVAPYIPSGLEIVMMRNNFYRKNYRKMVVVSLMLTLICGGLTGFIFYQYKTRPTPKYFATTEDGKILVLDELSAQSKTDNELFAWAKEAAIASFTYDFRNWRTEIQAAKIYYTPAGHRQLLKAITESRNLTAVKKKKLATFVEMSSTKPKIIDQGVQQSTGRYTWIIEFPMRVTYLNSNHPTDTIVQNLTMKMTISRVPIWDSSIGIGINSIVVREIIPPKPKGQSQAQGKK